MTYTPYCINDPNKTLSLYNAGWLDDLDKSKNISKINFLIKRCNSTRVANCSSSTEIDDWLEDKQFMMAIFNTRLSLKPPYDYDMQQYEKIVATVPIQKQTMSRMWFLLNKRMLIDQTKIF